MSATEVQDTIGLADSEPGKHGRFEEIPQPLNPSILKNSPKKGDSRKTSRRSSLSNSVKGEEGRVSRQRSRSNSFDSRSRSRNSSRDGLSSDDERRSEDSRSRQSRGTREMFHTLSRAANVALETTKPDIGDERMKEVRKTQQQLKSFDKEKLMKLKRKDDEWAKTGIRESNSKLEYLQKKLEDMTQTITQLSNKVTKTPQYFDKDPPICHKINQVRLNTTYPTIPAASSVMRNALKAVRGWTVPIVSKGGLKQHDENLIALLHILNDTAKEFKLTEDQQLELLTAVIPHGNLKTEIKISQQDGLEAVYDQLCVLNPAVHSIKELDIKLHQWRLSPARKLHDSLSELLALLGDANPRKVQLIGEGKEELHKELVLKMLRRVTDVTSGKLRDGLLRKMEKASNTHPKDLKRMSDYFQEIGVLCEKADFSEFKPHRDKGVQRLNVGQLNLDQEEAGSTHTPYTQPWTDTYFDDNDQRGYGTPQDYEVNQTSIMQRNHPLRDRSDFLKRMESQRESWLPRDSTEMWVQPFEGEIFTDGSKRNLNPALMKRYDNYCYKCGHCSHISINCKVYKDQPLAWTPCTRCRQGFHTRCLNVRKDLLTRQSMLDRLSLAGTSPQRPRYNDHDRSDQRGGYSPQLHAIETLNKKVDHLTERQTQAAQTTPNTLHEIHASLATISKDVKAARSTTPDANLGKKPMAKLSVQLLAQEDKIKALEEGRTTDFREQEALFQRQTDALSELVLSMANQNNARNLND